MKTYLDVNLWNGEQSIGRAYFVMPYPKNDFVVGVRTAQHHVFCLYDAEQGRVEKQRPYEGTVTKVTFELKKGEPKKP